MQEEFAISLTLRSGYEFGVDFALDGVPELITDEPPPLGAAGGPNPARLLAAAVGNCMSASLKFCLQRSRIEVQKMTTRVEGTLVRNERGRYRIGELRVRIEPQLDAEQREKIGRCLEIFEDFCIIGQSVREGVDVAVEVVPQEAEAGAAGED